MADLPALARTTLARNRFVVLGTVDPTGRPRVSPVWFSLVDYRDAYWLSSSDAHHSRNIQQRPEVSMVVFNSGADPHTGQAVYLEATAGRVPDAELADVCAKAFRDVDDELSYTPETLRHEPFVLCRARVTASEIHVRGRDFGDGTGSDQRVPVHSERAVTCGRSTCSTRALGRPVIPATRTRRRWASCLPDLAEVRPQSSGPSQS